LATPQGAASVRKRRRNTPYNAMSNRPYSGCNVILLSLARNRGWTAPRFLTFKQAIEVGGNVLQSAHGMCSTVNA
jgi:antirestriction protein ArdC